MPICEAIRRYLVWRQASGATPHTMKSLRYALRCLSRWAEGQGVTLLEQLTPDLFLSYQQQELPFRLTRQGRPITITTQLGDLCALRKWGRYLVDQDFLVSNPARRMKFPRAPNSLPRIIPDVKEATRLMGGAGHSGHAALVGRDDVCGRGENRCVILSIAQATRSRAILELLYGTGLRLSEAFNLNVLDLDLVGGYVWVRQGKGRKDRVAPLGQMAITALTVYLDSGRSELFGGKEGRDDSGEKALFLNKYGGRLSREGIYQVVKKAVICAKLSSKITPHCLRHAAATHMLQNGASIRHIQEFLGHASLETTQIYTRVTITDLKAMHAQYHPREKGVE